MARGSPNLSFEDDVGSLRRFLESRLEVFEARGEGIVPATFLFPAAALARCCSLLGGMMLVRADRPDIVGILSRQLFESWLVGMYVLLKGPPAMLEMAGDEVWWTSKMVDKIGLPPPPHHEGFEGGKKLNYLEIAQALGPLLVEDGDPPGTTVVPVYDRIYRGESLYSLHSGLASVGRYIDWEHSTIRLRPRAAFPSPDQVAAHHTAYLGTKILRRNGYPEDDVAELEALTQRVLSHKFDV